MSFPRGRKIVPLQLRLIPTVYVHRNSKWPSGRGVIRRLKTSEFEISTSPGLRPRRPTSVRENSVSRSVIRIVAGPVAASDLQVSATIAVDTARAPAKSTILSDRRTAHSFRRRAPSSSHSRGGPRKLDPEGRALPGRAPEGDPASVRLDDRACERQPEAGAGDP